MGQAVAQVLAVNGQPGQAFEVRGQGHGRQMAGGVEDVQVADRPGGEQFGRPGEELPGRHLDLLDEPPAEHRPGRQPAERLGPGVGVVAEQAGLGAQQVRPPRVGVGESRQGDLHADELAPLALADAVEPVGEDEPRPVVVRRLADPGQEPGRLGNGHAEA